jgi:peptidoglycan/xylan/chitin deacetylase (PgdA/CDA1 family)
MKLALKIDVQTLPGTRTGVPRLIDLLQRHNAQASFFFTFGPGRALFPGADLSRQCVRIMHQVRDAEFEVGIHAYNSRLWKSRAAQADAAWTQNQMQLACARFSEVFSDAPLIHGAPGWQMSLHSFRLTQRLGFDYGCDTRGTCPFVPIYRGEIIACPQLPTTLPTLNEAIASAGMKGAVEYLLKLSANPLATGHLYTLCAEYEGRKFTSLFEPLITGWRDQGYELTTTRTLFESLETKNLPRHEVALGKLPDTHQMLTLQSKEFLVG